MGKNGFLRFGFVVFATLSFGLLASAQEQAQEAAQATTQDEIIKGTIKVLEEVKDVIDPKNEARTLPQRIANLPRAQNYLTAQLTVNQSPQRPAYERANSVISGLRILSGHACQLYVDSYPMDLSKRKIVALKYEQVSDAIGARFEEQGDGSFKFVDKFSDNPSATKISLTFYNFMHKTKADLPIDGILIEGIEPSLTHSSTAAKIFGQAFASDDARFFSVSAFGTRFSYAVHCDRL